MVRATRKKGLEVMKKSLIIFSLLCAQIAVRSNDLLLALNDLPHERVRQLCQPISQQVAVITPKTIRDINKAKVQALKLKQSQKQEINYTKLAQAREIRKQEFQARESERVAKAQKERAQDDQLRAANQEKRHLWIEANRKADEIKRLAKLELMAVAKNTKENKFVATNANTNIKSKKALLKKSEPLLTAKVVPLPKIVQEKLQMSKKDNSAEAKKETLSKTVHHYLASQKDDEWIVPASLPTLRIGIPLDPLPKNKK